jgi:hypothetical protein
VLSSRGPTFDEPRVPEMAACQPGPQWGERAGEPFTCLALLGQGAPLGQHLLRGLPECGDVLAFRAPGPLGIPLPPWVLSAWPGAPTPDSRPATQVFRSLADSRRPGSSGPS